MSYSPSASPDIAPARDSWLVRVLGGASSDLRHAARLLAKSPGFAVATLLTLALCIGFNTAIFSAVYSLMLKPLPFPQAERIVEIYNTYPKAGGAASRGASNVVQLLDYQQNASSYSHAALWSPFQGMFGEDVAAERLHGARATADLFEVLGLRPLIGQFFKAENQLPNADKFIVLTQSFWEVHYREDPGVLGKTARLDGETFTIIGIAPRALEAFDARVRFLRPMSWDPARLGPRHGNGPRLVARLKPGTDIGSAVAEAENIERRFYDAGTPQVREFLDRSGHKIRVGRVQDERIEPLKTKLLLLQGGVLFVLCIGCVNVANLLLARANGRQSELAIRCALGATRGVIARQLLLESALLTGLGAALGIGLAWAGVRVLNHYRAEMMAQALPFTLDGRVLAFTAVVSVVAALLIGALPIVHILRTNLMGMIHRSSRGASGGAGVRALSSTLIIGQVAIALMLLTGAGLLIHSFWNAIAINPGFDPRGVVTGRIAIPLAHRISDDAGRQLQQRVTQSLREIPGVSSVALGVAVPFQGGLPVNAFTLAEDTLPPGSPQPGANRVIVSPDYFATLKLTLLEGRVLEPKDAAPNAPPVFVVDETFAKKYFAGRSALGGRFSFGGRPQKESDWPTVVGIVRNVPHRGVEDRTELPYVYHSLGARNGGLTLFLRTERPATDVISEMRPKLQAIDPAIALFDTGPLQQFIDASFNERRALMLLLGAYAGLALFLSALGIYGVLAYDVSQRTREIGIRGAIGATHRQVIGLIMRQGVWKAAIGLILGLVGAALLSRYLKTLLYDLSPTDPRAYAAVSVLLLAVAALASYLPARRAAKINPTEALRAE